MDLDIAERPNVLPWPPMIYAIAIVAALAFERFVHALPLAAPSWLSRLGWLALPIGLAFDFGAIATLYRARTNILPHRGADRLVDWGPFAFTRNPIYLGNTVTILGLGLALDNGGLLIATFVAAIATDRLAIRREEAHLEARFGDAFRDYVRRAPRWLGIGRFRL